MSSVTVDVTTLPQQVRDLVEEAIREGEVVLMCGDVAVSKIITVTAKRPRHPGARAARSTCPTISTRSRRTFESLYEVGY